jgi:hypothetical protein
MASPAVYDLEDDRNHSLIEQLLPKHIHAVKARGFELKVVLFVMVCSINHLVR